MTAWSRLTQVSASSISSNFAPKDVFHAMGWYQKRWSVGGGGRMHQVEFTRSPTDLPNSYRLEKITILYTAWTGVFLWDRIRCLGDTFKNVRYCSKAYRYYGITLCPASCVRSMGNRPLVSVGRLILGSRVGEPRSVMQGDDETAADSSPMSPKGNRHEQIVHERCYSTVDTDHYSSSGTNSPRGVDEEPSCTVHAKKNEGVG